MRFSMSWVTLVLCLASLGCVKPDNAASSDVTTYLKDKEPAISSAQHAAAMLRMRQYAETKGMYNPAVSCADYYVVNLQGDVDRADCGASSGPDSDYIYAACSISLDAKDLRNTQQPCKPRELIVVE